ncbi:peroxisomal N(1)-acetyl-spermine/spermidine oxidase [Tribolium castaneum]|uniref:Protein anon-37Cs-like Protein n=1 Tax=Tribolium castaneum TaxID=7070 RepID=D6WAZ4_TRICA|nr:PREDICTED: peroxisomal N(1)-acetyl-spermine/spermidine oxidase [Tribolium castaneum]EEZ98988.1 Protein anon-37Cs-like Protein [Tribolium castaneum]|eukprot:XP_971067.1 PREDICTED: peroxisomal N(1)-acetyl-spermine/spermidine oxidase [Tribolium castaneum]
MESSEAPSSGKDSSQCKVLIVGAGMAGLSAAYHLSKNGFNDYKLLEARNRVGGRIVQIKMGSEPVELGANWIHGVLGNPVYELAMQHGLVDIMQTPKPHKVIAATENGKQVPFATLHEIYEAYLCFLRRCEEYFLSQYLPPEGIDSVGDHIKLEISLYLDKVQDPRDRHLRELLFECLLKRETCISGCDDMSEIDLLELGTYTELQGGNITLPGGYSSILGPVTQAIPAENLLVGHPVSQIRWNLNKRNSIDNGNDSDDSDRTVIEETTKESNSPNVEVHCDNGKVFKADQLICTIPLGVLKYNKDTLFQPPLPEYKREAIDRLLFGTVDKILLEYERPFLHPSITEVLLLWESDTEHPEGQNDLSKNWYKKIYSFSKITETIILGWISGKEAEYMETLSKDEIKDTCTTVLRKFLNDPFIPKPKNVVCTSWHSQPYTRGSYTAIAVGASQIDIECLAQPLFLDEEETKPVVLFAGEHTHCNFYSTVHGAYLTGRTAAQAVLHADAPQEMVLDCEDDADLSSWVQGICLE